MSNTIDLFNQHPSDADLLVRRPPVDLLPDPAEFSGLHFIPRIRAGWHMRTVERDGHGESKQWRMYFGWGYRNPWYGAQFAWRYLTRCGFEVSVHDREIKTAGPGHYFLVTDPRVSADARPDPVALPCRFSRQWLATVLPQSEYPSLIVRNATLALSCLTWMEDGHSGFYVQQLAKIAQDILAVLPDGRLPPFYGGQYLRHVDGPFLANVVRCAAYLEERTAGDVPAVCLDVQDYYQRLSAGSVYVVADESSDLEGLWVLNENGRESPIHLVDEEFNIRVQLGTRVEHVVCEHCGDGSIEAGYDDRCLIRGCSGFYVRKD